MRNAHSVRFCSLLSIGGTVGMCRYFLLKADVFIFCRDILITNLDASMSYAELCDEVHEMCNLQQEQPITLKWIDDEGIALKYFRVCCSLWCREGALRNLYKQKSYCGGFLFLNTQLQSPVPEQEAWRSET